MRRRQTVILGVLLLAVAAVAVTILRTDDADDAPFTPKTFNLRPVRTSVFRNSEPDVSFVGADACGDCHEEVYQAWSGSAHGLALADVDPELEPSGGSFFDKQNRRRYHIEHRDGQFWHSEALVKPNGDELPLAEHPVRYVMGSGRFSRSYLIDVDGFLMESPCTWYTARPGWGLSPGYEQYNLGFERPAEVRCVGCHAGRSLPVQNSPHRLTILTEAIDCERCHGPGALHVQLQQEELVADQGIAHPGKLPRTRAEDICAQCHFHGEATVSVRGRELDDFRPGMVLEDFLIHYAFDSPDPRMTVVGHFEQMRLSPCYQQTQEFTCTTCHDPHHRTSAFDVQAETRRQCVACHTPDTCGVPVEERLQSHPEDHCAHCHMPQVPTEIPHFAFTHHRVAVHPPENPSTASDSPSQGTSPPPPLVSLDDVSWMPEIDQDRCLGLAYVQVLDQPENAQHAEFYRRAAVNLLEDVHSQGLDDPEVDAALSRLYFGRDTARTLRYARSALSADSLSPDAESGALFALSATLCVQGDATDAIPLLERLVEIRRYGGAWHLLSLAYDEQGDLEQALHAAIEAVQASPASAESAAHLAELYRRQGNLERANHFTDRAEALAEPVPSQ